MNASAHRLPDPFSVISEKGRRLDAHPRRPPLSVSVLVPATRRMDERRDGIVRSVARGPIYKFRFRGKGLLHRLTCLGLDVFAGMLSDPPARASYAASTKKETFTLFHRSAGLGKSGFVRSRRLRRQELFTTFERFCRPLSSI